MDSLDNLGSLQSNIGKENTYWIPRDTRMGNFTCSKVLAKILHHVPSLVLANLNRRYDGLMENDSMGGEGVSILG